MNKKNANEIFIQKLQRKYDNSYDLIGNYLDKNVKPKIIHKKCGHSFPFSPSHVIGKNAPSTSKINRIKMLFAIIFNKY